MSLLKKPAVTVWELVLRTGLSKSSVYRSVENLKKLKMVEKNEDGIRAFSLKHFVTGLLNTERKFGKLAMKIKRIAPFLKMREEDICEFETLFSIPQIQDAYLTMSQIPYATNLDFGDFENFISAVGDLSLANKFRANRVKHASHHAICTTFGPNTAYFSTKEAEVNFKNKVERLNINFDKRFIIFSDTNDYVFFGDVTDPEYPTAVTVRSKPIADSQRLMFSNFSQQTGN